MSKTRILVHIVFTTKHRTPTIPLSNKRRLYAYMHAIINNKKCTTLRINGTSDHVHILVNLHPSLAVADLVRDLKQSTSLWLKDDIDFKGFQGWNSGYYAASISSDAEEACINYIKNQEEHHKSKNFIQESKELAIEYMLDWEERDWD